MKNKIRDPLFLAIALLFFLSVRVQAQQKGINFEKDLSWEEVKAKAKAENKSIFMDVFASWCGPCKWMDENIYPSDKLTLLNDKFISVKVQMDTNRNDSEETKVWYVVAKQIAKEFKIKAYPTYLFFDPNGIAVHKFVGQLDDTTFEKLTKNALDPKRQYYSALKAYRNNALNYEQMPWLTRISKQLGEDIDSKQIAKDYIDNYLYKLNDADLFTKENLTFVTDEGAESFNSKSRMFSFIYKNPEKTDRIVGNKGFAQNIISWVVKKEELYNKLWKPDSKAYVQEPNWSKIKDSIKKKYSTHYADSLIQPTQLLFYKIEKNWKKYMLYAEAALKRHSPKNGSKEFGAAIGVDPLSVGTDDWALNQVAWTIFEESTDKLLLKKALILSKLSIEIMPMNSRNVDQYMDTQANLLYKLGRVNEAIELEEQAIRKSLSNPFVKVYKETLEKMKRKEPTWIVPGSTEEKKQ